MEFYIGQIFMGGWNFAPRGSSYCDGQLLAISQNTALFSLYGTTFGGDGRTTFGLPDLRGRFAMHKGSGPGLTPRTQGAKFGAQTHTLITTQMPAHNHLAVASGGLTIGGGKGATTDPSGTYLGEASSTDPVYRTSAGAGNTAGGEGINIQVGQTGGNQPFDIMNPTQVITYCVALVGIFPSRN